MRLMSSAVMTNDSEFNTKTVVRPTYPARIPPIADPAASGNDHDASAAGQLQERAEDRDHVQPVTDLADELGGPEKTEIPVRSNEPPICTEIGRRVLHRSTSSVQTHARLHQFHGRVRDRLHAFLAL